MFYLFYYNLIHEDELFNAQDSFYLTDPKEAFDLAYEIATSTGMPVQMICNGLGFNHIIKPLEEK